MEERLGGHTARVAIARLDSLGLKHTKMHNFAHSNTVLHYH